MAKKRNEIKHATCEQCAAHSIRDAMRAGERTPVGWCSVSTRVVLPIQTACVFYKPLQKSRDEEKRNAI